MQAAAVAVTVLAWASAFVAIRYVGSSYSPGSLALGRLVVGSLVLGATLDLDDFGITADEIGTAPVLAPGFGAQGARIEDLRALYGSRAEQVLVNESRGLLGDGPDGVAALVADRADRIRAALEPAA